MMRKEGKAWNLEYLLKRCEAGENAGEEDPVALTSHEERE